MVEFGYHIIRTDGTSRAGARRQVRFPAGPNRTATGVRLLRTPGRRRAPERDGMTDTMIVELGMQAMTIAAKMCAPVLLTALLIGFAISLFQSVTQIQEATLSFVPKAVGVGAALLFSGNWMLHEMVTYTGQLFEKLPQLLNA
jgi:flagellar biosynthesis protein FliQ